MQRADADFSVVWYSGSGAGGQHRNKHQNSARLTHQPTGIVRTAQCRKREESLRRARDAIIEELDRMTDAAGQETANGTRRTQVGSGMRGDKRRTYRFQEDRVADHFTARSARCSNVMRGDFRRLWI